MNGNNKPDSISRTAVAMSGGVDSSLAAALAVEAGLDVVGVIAVFSHDRGKPDHLKSAEATAEHLGIDMLTIDLSSEFTSIIENYFIREYSRGHTPSPCVLCNPSIKFGALFERIRDHGITSMATGHYARTALLEDGTTGLFQGLDPLKDQSYFLFGLNQDQLRRSVFPLGEMLKSDVRRQAAERGLPVESFRESQELCFITGSHVKWLEEHIPQAMASGDIIDTAGRKLGTHDGIHTVTIGQRQGLGIAAGKPVYVTRIDSVTNTVVVGERNDAMNRCMELEDVSWISGSSPGSTFQCLVRIRHNHTPAPARVLAGQDSCALVEFTDPQFAITPGQAAVFYDGAKVLGGGWIERVSLNT